jgi:hypothetical protein
MKKVFLFITVALLSTGAAFAHEGGKKCKKDKECCKKEAKAEKSCCKKGSGKKC